MRTTYKKLVFSVLVLKLIGQYVKVLTYFALEKSLKIIAKMFGRIKKSVYLCGVTFKKELTMETKQLPKRKEEVTKEAYKRYTKWFALDGETDVNGEEREAFVHGTQWADITMYERVRIYLTDYFNGCTMANFNPTNLIKGLADFMLEGVGEE